MGTQSTWGLISRVSSRTYRILKMRTKGSKKKDTSEIIFDPAARREFLTGFSKRKKERQEKARKEMEDQIKEEKQMIKDEIRKASNMHVHHAIVEDKVKHLRDMQGLSTTKSTIKEADGQTVEVSEIGMTADLTEIAHSGGNLDEAGEMNGEESTSKGVSNTSKKNLITKQTRLQKMTPNNSGRKCKKKKEGTFQKTKTINVSSSKKKKLAMRDKYQ